MIQEIILYYLVKYYILNSIYISLYILIKKTRFMKEALKGNNHKSNVNKDNNLIKKNIFSNVFTHIDINHYYFI